jgi:DMSO/TMAO reductase YedYZ molybdopterin-dependent catalytic subunit
VVGVQPHATYVVGFSFDDGYDSVDMQDAWRSQTLIAYAMNGHELPANYGAPVRLKVPWQLGYKSLKFLSRIKVAGTMKNIGKGLGSWQPEAGYSCYAGISTSFATSCCRDPNSR